MVSRPRPCREPDRQHATRRTVLAARAGPWEDEAVSRPRGGVPDNDLLGTVGSMTSSTGIIYGPVTEAIWSDEGGVKFTAWTVVVDFGGYSTTYWFQTESGAKNFVEHSKAG